LEINIIFVYSKHTKITSSSNSAWSSKISSLLIPEPNISNITSTGNLMPLIQAFPWQILGWEEMRFRRWVFIRMDGFD